MTIIPTPPAATSEGRPQAITVEQLQTFMKGGARPGNPVGRYPWVTYSLVKCAFFVHLGPNAVSEPGTIEAAAAVYNAALASREAAVPIPDYCHLSRRTIYTLGDNAASGYFRGANGVSLAAYAQAAVNACRAAGLSVDALNDEVVGEAFDALREFVRKCEQGEARSVRSYAQMKAILNKLDSAPVGAPTAEKTATFVRKVEGWTGDARLYKLSEPIYYGKDGRQCQSNYLITWYSAGLGTTYYYSNEHGQDLGSPVNPETYRMHYEALRAAGYTLKEEACPTT